MSDRYPKREDRRDSRDSWDAGTCRSCGKVHSSRCAVDGCPNPGTITDSISHSCSGQARWVCAHHWGRR
jgi:hypothetical protein